MFCNCQCEVDGDIEYEFPCYNYTEALEGLWSPQDARYKDGGIYGGVLLKTAASMPLSSTNPSIGKLQETDQLIHTHFYRNIIGNSIQPTDN